jgi:hypothetical protein
MQSTSKIKHVTNRNGVQLAKLAREYGVSRENFTTFLKDKKRTGKFFTEFFEELNADPWFEKIKVEAGKIGARVHLIPKLTVDYALPYNEAAEKGGSETEELDWMYGHILECAGKYQLPDDKQTDETIVLINFLKEGDNSYEKAVAFGLKQGLRLTTPHVPFAIGEIYPKLNYELEPVISVVETTGYISKEQWPCACYVLWDGSQRTPDIRVQSIFNSECDWFAFSK